ncbi:oxidoreductase [Qipengyuania marisflavi]|uniref:SDR family NAD(P)-dependent oxidoreductase n=1 Tax=Qipengyuania marisflavi TaxID=2486356 RepID=A0A5S3P8W5_9SPHN|nr:oxidoreductase [Qipengyuania marisflavi]TMM48884.1 SDR family NAD(P)-dependent oxidoreductase [Qipengyuania marisflavi]
MSFAFADIPELSGKTAIVTGANTGIGLEIARGLSRKGARVLLACRDGDKARAAQDDLQRGHERADVGYIPLDLGNISSVREAAEIAAREPRIDMLINNAGIMVPPLGHATAGCEMQFAVNHLGHFALSALLLEKLAEDGGGRVVTQSSIAHRGAKIDFSNLDAGKRYTRTGFYGQSKLANLLFALELDRRLRAAGSPVSSIACHPGIAKSELTRHLGPFGAVFGAVTGLLLNTSEQGALPALQAATDPDAQGGEYYGPYGLREMSGAKSGLASASSAARDPQLAARLWDTSVDLTGIDPQLSPA